MAGTTIAAIQELAGRFRDNERNLTLYFADLDTPPEPGSYNRVFGPPVGLTDAQWPTFPELAELLLQANGLQHYDPRDQRMEHVFTVDLRGVSLLGVPPDAAAMMLFISNASFHRACADGNPHTAVLFLRHEDLRRGPYQGSLPKRSMYRWSRRFSLVAVEVPGDVFDVPELDLPADHPLVELYDAIAEAPARLGGCPIGLRDDEPAWAESTPTLPWSERKPESSPTPALENSPTVVFAPHGGDDDGHTVPYQPQRVPQSSRTIPYDPNLRAAMRADRLLERGRASAYDDGDPASAMTFGIRSPGRTASPPFLMQFHRRFADVNLGQRGVMYVSGRSAYYQSRAL
ncbi:MAG: hypothetical protein KDK70_08440 [Myxococcales bacterium]|nr:hypothetical protein [Myxococcales bacterium]